MTREPEVLDKIKVAVMEYDTGVAKSLATRAIQEKMDLLQVASALTEAIRRVGDSFGRGEVFLPELVAAGDTMKQAMSIIDAQLKRSGQERETLGTLVLGTVKGDIHDIGKAIVASLFEAGGFRVVDLGVDVDAKAFVDAVRDHRPDILGLSALLTSTASEQTIIINLLKEAGLRDGVKVIVGGGAITQDFADQIGADGYGANAVDGVEVAISLMAKRAPKVKL